MLIWRCLRGLQIFQAQPKETVRFFLRLPLDEVVYEELLVTEVNVLWRLKADSALEEPESPLYEDLLTTDIQHGDVIQSELTCLGEDPSSISNRMGEEQITSVDVLGVAGRK